MTPHVNGNSRRGRKANDSEEALRQVRESQPDLIILDMLLPKLGGEHVLQALRQQ
jgi:two-component system response regulator VicR